MRALTVHQPWAWALIYADKVENRTWGTSYRGPVAIHAGQRIDEAGLDHQALLDALPLDGHGAQAAFMQRNVLGAVIGVADLVDIHPCYHLKDGTGCCEPWGEQEYVEERSLADLETNRLPAIQHWVFDNRRPLPEPIPCRGRQQLWNPPADVLTRIREQLGATA